MSESAWAEMAVADVAAEMIALRSAANQAATIQ
jgi:hypothetical protein